MNAQSPTAGLLGKKKAAIANLPSGIGVNKVSNGKTEFWRVRLGKRFTGGAVVTKHFSDLTDARNWIFCGAQKERAEPGSVLILEQHFGAAAFALSPAQINEAAWAVQNLPAGTSLTMLSSSSIGTIAKPIRHAASAR